MFSDRSLKIAMLTLLMSAGMAGGAVMAEDAPALIAPEIVKTIVEGNTEQKPVVPLQKLEDILRHSYAHNPALLAARAGMRAVQEKMPQAMAGWRPTVSASANVMSSDIEGSSFGGDGTTSKEIGAEITQPLYRGGRTVAATDSAMNAILAQRALLVAREQDILLAVATAYMDVSRDTALLALSENNKSVIGEQLRVTQRRFDVGELTKTDLAQAKARLAKAEAEHTSAQGNLQKSKAVFEQVTGQPAGEIGRPKLGFPIPDMLDGVLALAEKNNPRTRAARFLHRAAQEDIDVVFGGLLPEVGLFGSWDRAYDPQPGLTDKSTTASVGVSASIPIYDAGLTRSRTREAKHTANQRYMEILDADRRVREEAVAGWENLRATNAEIESRKAQVEAARVAQEGVHAETELGARTILDSLDADQEYLDARAALVTAERNGIVAGFALAATLGRLTPEVLGFPELKEDYDAHLDDIMRKILGTDVDIAGDGAH